MEPALREQLEVEIQKRSLDNASYALCTPEGMLEILEREKTKPVVERHESSPKPPLKPGVDDLIAQLIERVATLELEKIEVPSLCIPNWPLHLKAIVIDLGEQTFLMPKPEYFDKNIIAKTERSKGKLRFTINAKGAITLEITPLVKEAAFPPYGTNRYRYSSVDTDPLSRVILVVLFYQFRQQVCTKVLEEIEKLESGHKEVVGMIKKVLAPFLEYSDGK